MRKVPILDFGKIIDQILTSDDATDERYTQYQDIISFICTHVVNEEWEDEPENREMAVSILTQLLSKEGAVAKQEILKHKVNLGVVGLKRIQEIRSLEEGSEERDYATLELEAWEKLMVAFANN